MTLRIVARGTWLYGGSVETPVDVVALDYNWDHELHRADGHSDFPELPEPLNDEGFLYYARFQHALETSEPTWPDSPACQTIEEAKRHAERKVAGGIKWSAEPA
jgi:hypothetical protein